MQMDGNDQYGDCTCGPCLGNVLDVVKRILKYGGGAIPDANVISWAIAHGFQNGAEIIDVLNALATDPMIDASGQPNLIGPNAGVDFTDTSSVDSPWPATTPWTWASMRNPYRIAAPAILP